MSTTCAYANVFGLAAVPGYAARPPAFAATFGLTGFTMKIEPVAGPPVAAKKLIEVYSSKKTVRFPWFTSIRWNRGPPRLFSWALVTRYGRIVVAELYGLLRLVAQMPFGTTWTKPRDCQNEGGEPAPPPPPTGCWTASTRRDVPALFFMSVAFNRTIDPSQ